MLKLYPLAEILLLVWFHEFRKIHFDRFNQLKSVDENANIVANKYVWIK